jgi:hypothetical protein
MSFRTGQGTKRNSPKGHTRDDVPEPKSQATEARTAPGALRRYRENSVHNGNRRPYLAPWLCAVPYIRPRDAPDERVPQRHLFDLLIAVLTIASFCRLTVLSAVRNENPVHF